MISVVALSALCLLAILPVLPGLSTTAAQADPASQLLDLVNGLRAQYGKPPYRWNPELAAAAQDWTEWRAAAGDFGSHIGPDGSRPSDRAIAAGYGGGMQVRVLENVAGGANMTPTEAVAQWQGDADHLNVMLSDVFQDAGAGFARAGSLNQYTLVVGVVKSEPLPTRNVTVTPTQPATATPQARAATAPRAVTRIHVLEAGETLAEVAAANGMDLSALLALNGLAQNSLVFPGQEIVVTAPTPAPVQSNRALLKGLGVALTAIGMALIALALRSR